MKETPPNTTVELRPCLLIRPLEADTLPVLLARAHNTVEPLFNRDTGGPSARLRYFHRLTPCVRNNNFLVCPRKHSFIVRSTTSPPQIATDVPQATPPCM
jgi:hypothetical protein